MLVATNGTDGEIETATWKEPSTTPPQSQPYVTVGFARAFGSRKTRPCDGCADGCGSGQQRRGKTRCAIPGPGQPCLECVQTKKRCTFDAPPPVRRKRKADNDDDMRTVDHHYGARPAPAPLRAPCASLELLDRPSGSGSLPLPEPLRDPVPRAIDEPPANVGSLSLEAAVDPATFEATAVTTLLTDDLLPVRPPLSTDSALGAKPSSFHLQVSADPTSPAFLIYTPKPRHRQTFAGFGDGVLRDVRAALSLLAPDFDEDDAVQRYLGQSHPVLPFVALEMPTKPRPMASALRVAVVATSLVHCAPLARGSEAVWTLIKSHKVGEQALDQPVLSGISTALLELGARPVIDARNDFGLLCKTIGHAQLLGLHSSCAGWAIPQWEKDLRVRLWWGIRIHDAFISILRSMPSHLQAGNSSTPLPTREGRCPTTSVTQPVLQAPSSPSSPPASPAFYYLCKLSVVVSRFQSDVCTIDRLRHAREGRLIAVRDALDLDLSALALEVLESSFSESVGITCVLFHLYGFNCMARRITLETLHGVGAWFSPEWETLHRFAIFVAFVESLKEPLLQGFWLPYSSHVLSSVVSSLIRFSLLSLSSSPSPSTSSSSSTTPTDRRVSPPTSSTDESNPISLLSRLCVAIERAHRKYAWDVAAPALVRAAGVATRLRSIASPSSTTTTSSMQDPGNGDANEYRAIIAALERNEGLPSLSLGQDLPPSRTPAAPPPPPPPTATAVSWEASTETVSTATGGSGGFCDVPLLLDDWLVTLGTGDDPYAWDRASEGADYAAFPDLALLHGW